MHVVLEQSGGFAGLTLEYAVDSASLPPAEAIELRALVEGAKVFELPPRLARAGGVDRFAYVLRVEDGARRQSVRIDEAAVSAPMASLIEWLRARGPSPRSE